MSDAIYGFGNDDVKRIGDAVRRIEKQPYPGTPPNQRPGLWQTGTIEAIVTTAITACNGTTYGIGAAQPYIDQFNSNSNSYTAVPDYSYASTTVNANTNAVTTTNTVTVLNWSLNSNTIAVNTHIMIGWRNGTFRFISGDC